MPNLTYDNVDWQEVANVIRWDSAQGAWDRIRGDLALRAGWSPEGVDANDTARWSELLDWTEYHIGNGSTEWIPWDLQTWVAIPMGQTTAPGAEVAESPVELTAGERSAKANLQSFLDQYGLRSLGDYVWKEFLNNIPIEQIMLDIRARPEYEARFPAMKTLGEKGHAMSEGEYIAYEKTALGMMRDAGMPPDFYNSPDDFARLLTAEVSIAELQSRIQEQYNRVANTDPAIRDWFAEKFGAAGDSALAAIYLDPELALPALEKMTSTAVFGGIGRQYGIDVGLQLGTEAANIGLNEGQAHQGFEQVAAYSPLEQGTIGEGAGLTEEELTRGVFQLNPGASEMVKSRLLGRAAEFAGYQGGPIETQEGAIGLGTSSRGRRS